MRKRELIMIHFSTCYAASLTMIASSAGVLLRSGCTTADSATAEVVAGTSATAAIEVGAAAVAAASISATAEAKIPGSVSAVAESVDVRAGLNELCQRKDHVCYSISSNFISSYLPKTNQTARHKSARSSSEPLSRQRPSPSHPSVIHDHVYLMITLFR